MNDKVFVDSGILVAAYDSTQPEIQNKALQLLDHWVKTKTGFISPQVLAEWFVSVTKRIAVPLEFEAACDRMQLYQQILTVANITSAVTLDAARGVRRYHLNFWDAQIWATARQNQIRVVCTHTALAGSMIEGIRFINPLTQTFHINDLP